MLPENNSERSSSYLYSKSNFSQGRLIHDLFADRVQERPEAVAVTSGVTTLTFKALDDQATALAVRLKLSYGVGPGSLVALYLDRSEQVLISILAVLKTGAAYVPIAPDTQARRIELILRETESPVILTDEHNAAGLAEVANAGELSIEVIVPGSCIDLSLVDEAPVVLGESHPGSDSLAYVIYTSGTTGRPKGVMVEHGSVVNYIGNVRERLGMSLHDVCGYSTNLSFDLTVTTTLACLALGGRVAVYLGDTRDVDAYHKFLVSENVSFIKLTPRYFGLLADFMHETAVRTVVLGGEKLSRSVLERVRVRPDQQLVIHDEYGPTEATVGTCEAIAYPLPRDAAPNIGRFYENYHGYVLDAELNPVVDGEVGELFIAGLGLARGYLAQPELTGERFLEDPFGTESESRSTRMYRTGDLVRVLADGNLEYLGRNDDQVKIRGYRVELGEIEHAVELYGDVERAVIVSSTAGKDENGGLVAYVVAGDFGCSEEALVEHLGDILPEYMIPYTFVFLDELPLTTNGKVDKNALPEPKQVFSEAYVAPRTDLENAVAEVWTEMLGRDGQPIGITDNFFRLGGDSIIAVQLLGKLRQRTGVHLPANDLLSRPTIEQLCELLIQRMAEKPFSPNESEVDRESADSEFPLLPIQDWFFRSKFARSNHWNQSFLIVTPRLDTDRLRECVRELEKRHSALRFRYRLNADNQFVQYYSDDGQPSELASASVADITDLQALLTKWQSDFNLERGPVFRVGYLDGFQDGSARVFVACHHLVVDAVSWRIIAEDLESLYRGVPLLPAGNSYGQWAVAIQNYPSQEPEEIDSYWTQVQRDYEQTDSGDVILSLVEDESTRNSSRMTLDEGTTDRLLSCHQTYHTQINDVLLAAFAHALATLTGEMVNYIILEGHGREQADPRLDLSRTVGWFTTMFPVRLAVGEDLGQTLYATKETLRGLPDKGLGYGARYGYYNGRLPRINFNYLGQFGADAVADDSAAWRLTREPSGASVHPENRDNNVITINGWIIDGKLDFNFVSKLDQETIDLLAAEFNRYLVRLVNELSAAPRSYLTPSDIDHAVPAEYLAELQSEIEIESIIAANSLQRGFVYQAISHGRDDDAYTVQMKWSYAVQIDVDAFREAWRLAQREFPTLRLRFGWRDDIVQIIDAASSVDLYYYDLSEETVDDQEAAIEQVRLADRSKPYDLSAAALFRIYLLKLGDRHFICLFSHHHSILDGWSNTLLLGRVHELYEDLIGGLPKLKAPDRSYLSAQKFLQEHRNDHLVWWRTHLAQHDLRMDLQGLLRPKARESGLRIESARRIEDLQELSFILDGERLSALREHAQELGVTLNAVIAFAWNGTLGCYSGSKQTVTGVVLSGRDLPVNDLHTSVGLFINTLPLIVSDESSRKSVADGIQEVQRRINELGERSTVHLTDLHRGTDRLFDTLFIYENWPKTDSAGWRSSLSVQMGSEYEKLDYPLSAIVTESPHRLEFRLAFAAELFDKDSMTEMLDVQQHLLNEILIDSERSWQNVMLLPRSQSSEVAVHLNQLPELLPRPRTFVEVFEDKAHQFPDHVAVVCNGKTLTYAELEEQANRLANAYGPQPGELIVLCLGKGFELIVSILAVLKMRAAYVLIDPSYPDSRVAHILQDTAAPLVFTTGQHVSRISELGTCHVVALDSQDLQATLAASDTTAPGTYPSADSLMYVLYTSGSTGVPKGVMIEHKAFTRTVAAVRSQYFNDVDQVNTNSLTNQVFDIFGLEYGLPLWTGGSVELTTDIPSDVDCAGLDFLQMTPSVCDVTLDRLTNVSSDLLLFVGGERLPKELLDRVLSKSINVVHVYGPTETTIWSTSRLYRHKDGLDGSTVSLGEAFAGESVHVLDRALRPLPTGAIGELCIGGEGLARGYLHNDELTAERFASVSASSEEGTHVIRLYRTGDLVRLLPSGVLEFVGRKDDQVKLEGHRIELGEIDGTLASHPAVRHSAVVLLELGMPTLVAYYVADRSIGLEELRRHLLRTLPGYMLPSRFVHLENMPLTISGKVDRSALPLPSGKGIEGRVPPRNHTEIEFCALVARLLGLDSEEVGIDDDFFHLGGNSLLSIRLVSAAEREMGVTTTVGELLEKRTIRGLVDNLDKAQIDCVHIPGASFERPEDQVLSFAQERLWFIEQFEGGTFAYNLPLVLEVGDDVDSGDLSLAVSAVVRRHETLRTLLKRTPEGNGYQEVVSTDVAVETMQVPDMETLRREIRRDLVQAFDLASELPLRAKLYDVAGVGRRLVFVVHHVAFDGWSIDLIVEDLLTAHEFIAEGIQGTDPFAELPAPDLRYRDFAVWQRAYLTGERLSGLRRFWAEKLEDHEILDLVPDRPRPDNLDYRGANIHIPIGSQTSKALRRLAEELNVSLFSLLLSAYFLTLRCFSNQDDVIVGVPVANRPHPRLDNVVGFFVNTLPVRTCIDDDKSIVNYVNDTAREVLDLLQHQELPFEQLLEILEIERDTSRHPVFQVTFGVQSFGAQPSGDSDSKEVALQIAPETQDVYTAARFDLSMDVDDSHEALELRLNYAISLFDRATVDSIAQTYLTILRQFASLEGSETGQKNTRICDLVYLEGDRRREMVEEWSAPREQYSSNRLLHQAVEEHSRRRPDKVALVFQDRQFTYQALNAGSNRLAHLLQQTGDVQCKDTILLCLDRGPDIVLSILATLKVGGAYLPADPTYPDDRIRFMIADGGVHTVLTHRRYIKRFTEILASSSESGNRPEFDKVNVIAIDDPNICKALVSMPDTDLNTEIVPEHVAYILYTSGTTGKPKGVPQTHANVTRLFAALESVYQIEDDDVWTLFHNYVFDFTVWEMWGALLKGGRLVIPTFEETRDPELYYALCRRERVSMLCQTPTAFYQFVDVALSKHQDDSVDDLRYVFFGGEPLNVSMLESWFTRYGYDRPLLAMGYGTTETTVFTCYKIYRETDEGSTDIGALIPDVAGYVLDAKRRPLPMGAVGELHIGGAGLSPGFLNHPDLTERKFVTNPFTEDEETNGESRTYGWNNRLYKSGDLVRWAPDRTLRFVGRNDLQVKIRGHRIEVGEIEAVLSSLGGVHQCAVVVNTTDDGDKQLLGYYIAEPHVELETLYDELRSKLPTYMIPAALLPISHLPRKITGKLDTDALPLPQLRPGQDLVAPRDGRESRIRDIMAEVLGAEAEAISVHDDFFRLGGNSILSIKVASRLSVELGTVVSIASIFRQRTVADIADASRDLSGPVADIPRLEASTETEHVPSFAQERFWFVDQYLRENIGYNIHLCYEILPGVDVAMFERCLRQVIRRHEILRTVIRQTRAGHIYQMVLDPETAPPDISYESIASESDLIERFGAASRHKFDLSNEAPLQIIFYRQDASDVVPEKNFVGLIVHHIAFDGWSADILLDEVSQLYREGFLPEPSLQYKDYAAWERSRLGGTVLNELLEYWVGHLRGRRPLELPTDRIRPANIDPSGGSVSFEIDIETSSAVYRLARQNGVGLFSVLLSAYFLTLQIFTGRSDMLVGIPVANRTHFQTHELVGCLINTLVLDFDIESDDSVEGLIKKVAARVIEAQEYQELPLERLVAELQPPVDATRNPLFQIWFDVNSFAETEADRQPGNEPTSGALLRTHTLDGHSQAGGPAINANLDFGLVINDGGETLAGHITYATALFDQSTVNRFVSIYQSILIQFARTI